MKITFRQVFSSRAFEKMKGTIFLSLRAFEKIKNKTINYEKVVFSFTNLRIGDCIGAQGIIAKFRTVHPNTYIYLISDIMHNKIKLKWVYDDIVNEIVDVSDYKRYSEIKNDHSIKKLGFLEDFLPLPLGCQNCPGSTWGDDKCYGMIWFAAPYFAKLGFLPNFKFPKNLTFNRTNFKVPNLNNFIKVVIHILEDAPYQKQRNHNVADFLTLCKLLVDNREDILIIRIGLDRNNKLPNYKDRLLDLTDLNLTIEESAYIISLADIYIGGDTGMTHLAGALGVKNIIAIYAAFPTDLPCTMITGFGELSSFPLVEKERISKIIMQNNRFDPAEVYGLMEERLNKISIDKSN